VRIVKRFGQWIVSVVRKLIEPDFSAAHYPLHTTTPTRYPDLRSDGLVIQPRGHASEDFLAGMPSAPNPNATMAGFPRRSIMIAYHGWRVPTPPQLPVYD
jgi:hypothetical protein